MKKILKISLVSLFILAVLGCLLFFVFTGIGTGFARACSRVGTGMTRDQALDIMSDYQNNNGVEFTDKPEELAYGKEGFSGDYQCYIFIDGQGRVSKTLGIFD
jgi:hypothetical protein